MAAKARAPAIEAPSATSTATFSLGAHSAWTPSYSTRYSRISVLGVPGYAAATRTPASKAPRAMASFPESKRTVS